MVPPRRDDVPKREALFLCTGNSARSILAEAILAHLGGERFGAHSAGSHPRGQVDPRVARFLEARGFPMRDARSKSWDEYAGSAAPSMDVVITVCDALAAAPAAVAKDDD
jgi:arsenate reductase